MTVFPNSAASGTRWDRIKTRIAKVRGDLAVAKLKREARREQKYQQENQKLMKKIIRGRLKQQAYAAGHRQSILGEMFRAKVKKKIYGSSKSYNRKRRSKRY